MPADLYLPPKPPLWTPARPAIIRASELPRTPAEARRIEYDVKLGLGAGGAATIAGVGAAFPELAFLGSPTRITGGTGTHTYTDVAITPFTGLLICVACWGTPGFDDGVESATFGGNAATLAIKMDADQNAGASILYREGTYGSTVTVAITADTAFQFSKIALYSLVNYNSAAPAVTPQQSNGISTNQSVTMTVPARGVALLGTGTQANSATINWTNADKDVEDGATASASTASHTNNTDSDQTSRVFTGTWSASTRMGLSGAVWR